VPLGVNASHTRPCETITRKVDCTSCHEEVGQKYLGSTHGQLVLNNDPNGPSCKECHGTHFVKGKQDPQSPTFATNVPGLCARCHREGEKAAVRYNGSQHQIVEHYAESIHGKGLLKSGLTVTATCTNCHTAHSVLPKSDPASSVNPQNVPDTCGRCHHGIQEQFEQSIHHVKAGKTDKKLPVCSDCHSAHTISRADAEGFKLDIMNKCGRCHEENRRDLLRHLSRQGVAARLHENSEVLRLSRGPRHSAAGRPALAPQPRKRGGDLPEVPRRGDPTVRGYLTHATHHDPAKYPFLFWTFWA